MKLILYHVTRRILRDAEQRLLADFNDYVDAFVDKTGIGISTISGAATGDRRFIAQIKSGSYQLTPRKYDQVVAWLDAEYAKLSEEEAD
jgi:hypothetical protein